MTARDYIEAIAQELSRAGGKGLLLSPADAQLALSWHKAQVPLQTVLAQLRRAARPRRAQVRGASEPGFSLQILAQSLAPHLKVKPPRAPKPDGIAAQLQAAARVPGLAARAAWEALADAAEDLLADETGELYWSAAVGALKQALRELPRSSVLQAGAALRARIAPRPRTMPRRRYQRSLQLMLLSAASERLGLPPRAFLL
jgi:hypothetical protein